MQGGTVVFIRADVRDRVQVRTLVEETVATYGGVDIVCNNAGIDVTRSLVETTEDEWDATLDTNLKGPFLLCKYALPYMVAKKKGVVVNVASQMGHVAAENLSAYCASKAGLIHLTKVIALEYAKFGIRANCISPGPIQTPGLEQTFSIEPAPEEAKRNFIRKVPLNRFGTPEEIARGVLFLASDRSSYVNGASLVADGGYILR
jgi:NAD(P)-dependent dehydrogenase (short-subunit alcohol dehydrogenase family)